MANLTTSADLVDEILFLCGEPTDGTSDFNGQALIYLNKAYQVLCQLGGGEFTPNAAFIPWWWLRASAPGVITMRPAYTTGNSVVTNDSATIEFTDGPSGSRVNHHFKVDDHGDVFRLTAHVAGATTATIDSVYTGETATAASFNLFQLEYDLPTDCTVVISPMRVYQQHEQAVNGMEVDQLDRKWPLNRVQQGVPRDFAVVRSVSGVKTVRFSHYGADGSATYVDAVRLDFDYLTTAADLTDDAANFPLLPREYRHILAVMGAYYLAMTKDDTRAAQYAQEASNGINRMIKENLRRWQAMTRNEGKIMPRGGGLPQNFAPLRTESGHIIG